MLQLAIASEPRFQASRIELEREGPSYTLHTVEALAQENRLTFICGADAFHSPWHRPDAVLEHLEILLIAHRYGVPSELPTVLAKLPEQLRAKVQNLPFPDIAISSTELRERVRGGRPFRYLVPDSVHDHIIRHRLYTAEEAPREGAPEVDEKGDRPSVAPEARKEE